MDTSEQYILMCKQAEEIQEAWKPKSGDFVAWPKSGPITSTTRRKVVVLYFNTHHGSPPQKYTDTKQCIWLPREDQLQEMTIFAGYPFLLLEAMYTRQKGGTFTIYKFGSLEQLWLAFVMHEKYGKIWNGEEWANK
jgi:hypothetical protein